MPSSATITNFYIFTANTRARASQVDVNFDVFRGHFISIEPLTATSSNLLYDIGSTEHRWRDVYVSSVDLVSSTTTAAVSLKANTAITGGALQFKIGGTEYGRVDTLTKRFHPAATLMSSIIGGDTTFIVPTLTYSLIVGAVGGGGSGGGGDGAGGYGGGGGAAPFATQYISVVPGDALTLTVGSGGGSRSTDIDGADGTFTKITYGLANYFWAPGGGGQSHSNGGNGGYGGGGNRITGSSGGKGAPGYTEGAAHAEEVGAGAQTGGGGGGMHNTASGTGGSGVIAITYLKYT